jgi:hypothetical protein
LKPLGDRSEGEWRRQLWLFAVDATGALISSATTISTRLQGPSFVSERPGDEIKRNPEAKADVLRTSRT